MQRLCILGLLRRYTNVETETKTENKLSQLTGTGTKIGQGISTETGIEITFMAFGGGGSVGECSRLSQLHYNIVILTYLLT